MIRRPPRSTPTSSSAASDVYKRQVLTGALATYLANYIQKHLWIAYVGLGFILLVAIQLVIGGLVDLEILNINEKYIKYF